MPELAFEAGPTIAGKHIPVPKLNGHPTAKARKSVGKSIDGAARAGSQAAGATARAAERAAHAAGDAARAAPRRAKTGVETGRAAVQFAQNVMPRERPPASVHRGRAVAAAIAAGAGIEYLLDPADGKRRRHTLRDQAVAAGRRFAHRGGQRARYAVGKAQGAVRGASSTPRPADDQLLADRVRSEIFRRPDAPKGSVNVGVVDGVVTLRGEVQDPAEIERLVSDARAVPGVHGVQNLLHAPGAPAPMGGAA
jgi:osmotically-inducible protein OsmY